MDINIKNYKEKFGSLFKSVETASSTNNAELKKIFDRLQDKFHEVEEGGDLLKRNNEILKIGVVGQVKAGKSSFLNSLFFDGENVLPRASTPMTAGLTVLEYGEENKFTVEYYTKNEWQKFEDKAKEYDDIVKDFKSSFPNLSDEEAAKMANIPDDLAAAKELVERCQGTARRKIGTSSEDKSFTDKKDLQDILESYVGADGQYTSIVKSLSIHLNDERLKGVRIVDTPGVNDPVVSREHRTREFLRECHGVFFLSFASRFFDSTDVSFLTNRIGSQGIGTIVLIASKFDSVLQDSGSKFHDDLGNAIEDCERQLKAQFRRNLAGADYKGHEPILAMSSGIGYSISHKKPSDWDKMESHVVQQMKSFYPSFFATDEDIKHTFDELSQIEDIRKSYLEGVFVKNRDKIILDKVNDYFANVAKQLKNLVDDSKKHVSESRHALDANDISHMKQLRASTLKMVDTIASEVSSMANRCDDEADRLFKESKNGLYAPSIRVPLVDETITIIRQSTFWGRDKRVACSYRKVDDQRLVEDAIRELRKYAESYANNWNQKAQQLIDSMNDAIGKLILDAEMKDSEARLDADGLRRVLREVIASMANEKTMDVTSLVNQASNEIMDIAQDCEFSKSVGQVDESTAQNKIRSRAEDKRREIETKLRDLIDSFVSDVDGLAKNSKNEVIKIFRTRKDELVSKSKASVKEYLDNLERALEDKENQLKEYDKAANCLNEIEKLL